MASLTQQEAADRAALLDVQRYDVHLDLSGLLRGQTLRSDTTVAFTCAEPGATTFLDVVADAVIRVELNGQDVEVEHDGERLVLRGLAAENVLRVRATTDQTSSRTGLFRAVDPADDEPYVWTTFEPDDARRVFACFDQPDLKAVFAFRATAPEPWLLVHNTPGTAVTVEGADGAPLAEWTFEDTPRLSTYVTALCAGPFHEVRRRTATHDLSVLARRSLGTFLDEQADDLFETTEQGLAWFGEHFGQPFPQRHYAQVFAPDYQGAMENFGCVVWTDSVVFRTPPTAEQQLVRAMVLLHEMAHMWFGDMVTMQWWDDLWLNESFADWAAYWALAGATRHASAAWAYFVGNKEKGYVADAAPTTHPIRRPVPDVEAAKAGFDMVTYAKGSAVLKQLAAYVGEEAFVAGLRTYFAEHLWGNATLDDLLAHVGRASGRDLAGWSQDWLRTDGTDTLELVDDGALRQTAPADHDTLRTHRVDVGVYDLDGEGDAARLRRRALVDAVVEGERTDVPALRAALAERPADLVLPNDDDLGFVRVRLDERSAATALAHGPTLAEPVSRSLLRLVLWQGVEDGVADPADVVRYTLRALPAETEPTVQDALLRTAVDGALWWTGAGRDALQQEVAAACLGLLDGGGEGGGPGLDAAVRTSLLRAAARTAGPDQLDAVTRLAGDEPDLRWRLLVRAAAVAGDGDDAVAAQEAAIEQVLAADPDPDAKWRAVAVRAARPTAAAKAEVWRTVAVDRDVPQPQLPSIAQAFWTPGQEELVADYAERYLALLPEWAPLGMLQSMILSLGLFPKVGVGADYPARAVSAAAGDGVSPLVSTIVRGEADRLERMLRARAR